MIMLPRINIRFFKIVLLRCDGQIAMAIKINFQYLEKTIYISEHFPET